MSILDRILPLLGVVAPSTRTSLAREGREIKEQIEAIGIPKMWGTIPPEMYQNVLAWRERCARGGLSSAAVFQRPEKDLEHTSASEVLLLVDQTILALDPPASMGG